MAPNHDSFVGDGLGMRFTTEHGVLWSEGEGQIVNALTYLVCGLTFWLVVPGAYALATFMRTACHRYELTDQRLRETTGVFFRRTDELELYRVADIAVEQPLLQRFVDRGRVVLRTADRSTPTVTLNAVPRPTEVANLIREHVERCRVAKGVRHFDT
jgi:uncharacterized membrane protein YdbT with pleckstrin-like domain